MEVEDVVGCVGAVGSVGCVEAVGCVGVVGCVGAVDCVGAVVEDAALMVVAEVVAVLGTAFALPLGPEAPRAGARRGGIRVVLSF